MRYAEFLSSVAHVQVPTNGLESAQCIQRKFLLGMQHGDLENLTTGLQNMLIASRRQLFNLDWKHQRRPSGFLQWYSQHAHGLMRPTCGGI
jgi:hypothetical protein